MAVVNYKISQQGRRKPEQFYHVNLLKPWKDRESLVAKTTRFSTPFNLAVPEVGIAETLSKSQQQEVKEFVLRNKETFSDLARLGLRS